MSCPTKKNIQGSVVCVVVGQNCNVYVLLPLSLICVNDDLKTGF